MKFCDALWAVNAGAIITREIWKETDEDATVFIENEVLKIKRDGITHNLIVSSADIVADDWTVVQQARLT